MFNRILVPLDGSLPATAALTIGKDLAERLDADLHVLTLTHKGRMEEGMSDLIERQVARVKVDPKVDVRSLSYSVPEDIAAEFDQVDETLVVMQTWARGRTAGVVGNISEEVQRLVRKPVIMIGPDIQVRSDWLQGPMFIATDGSHFGDSVVPPASQMARALQSDLQLVTVIDQSAVPAGVGVAGEANSLAGLAGDVEAITGRTPNYDVLHGPDPADAITDHAKRHDASLIAMSTHGRSGLSRLAFDSVAMSVVRHAHCPVLLSRPAIDEH